MGAVAGALLACAVVAGCAASSEDRVWPGEPLESFTPRLDIIVKQALGRYDIPGASLAIVRNGELQWSGAYGLANRETGRPMTSDTVCRVASVSKSFTAWGVMTLVEDGRVDLDAPIGDYVTRWRIPPSDFSAEEVTVRRLLSHASGLPTAILEQETKGQTVVSPEALLTLAGVRLTHEPGSRFEYANSGYVLLQLLIEEATGRAFADYMRETVLAPLGMDDSRFEGTPELRPRTATGYLFDGEPADTYELVAQGAGGLYATAPDLARFVAAQGRGPDGEPPGRGVLRPETVELLHTPAIPTVGLMGLATDAYGFGFLMERLPTGERAVMHGGQLSGWISHFYAAPATGDGIVILTNSQRSQQFVGDVAGAWARWCGFESVKMTRAYARIGSGARLACLGLFIFAAGLALRLVVGIVKGERRLVLTLKPAGVRRLVLVGAGIGLFVGWGVGRATVVHLFPALGQLLQIAITLAGALLILSGLIPSVTAPAAPSPADD